jgi:hypothetical protein
MARRVFGICVCAIAAVCLCAVAGCKSKEAEIGKDKDKRAAPRADSPRPDPGKTEPGKDRPRPASDKKGKVVIKPGTRDLPGGVKVSSGGKPVWPPKGPGCEKLVQCCIAASASVRALGLACQLSVAKPPVDCGKALATVTGIMKEQGKTLPKECSK